MTFSGLATGTIADDGYLTSDPISISIPDGAAFWVRTFATNSGGMPYCTGGSSLFGEYSEYAASGLTDKTMSGTISTGQTNALVRPIAIIGKTTKPALLLLGDSRMSGEADVLDASGDTGEVARSIGQHFAYCNLGAPGELAAWFVSSHAKRALLAQYASHIIEEYGTNDIYAGSTTADQLAARIASIISYFPGKVYARTTIAPRVVLTNGTSTAGGQTPVAGEPVRVAFNAMVRAGLAGVARYYDVAEATETARDSGLWKAGYTGDGVHENQVGALGILASGVIDPNTIYR